ncbi:contact-dependent growth inhibition system immunity protein [Polaribacter sp. MSW13]|uniref:Contact-dependent growth inhibition system immunity protein n=1 Tax=Polaribacter marinus TaxID=2916838 RepID=A0A9X2ALC7_9FLAO|nr:contact-dependent growth inhibition system immunity protein [Polaribacter marinus]MCI2230473.1 contact-dependent growth inhibition system immunity protein [Polaribacter marinus]
MLEKSIEQLENNYWKEESEFPTNLVKRCFEYRKIKLSELTIEQIRLLISQEIGIEFLIGIALEKLELNIIAEGNLYEGDLLDSVSKISNEFWKKNKFELKQLKIIIEKNKETIKTELGEKEYERISERIKASCQHRI